MTLEEKYVELSKQLDQAIEDEGKKTALLFRQLDTMKSSITILIVIYFVIISFMIMLVTNMY